MSDLITSFPHTNRNPVHHLMAMENVCEEAPVGPVLKTTETYDMVYEFTAKTFRKTSRLPLTIIKNDGTSFTWCRSWNHERIANEAKALQLISKHTEIPVPKVLAYGVHADGRQYLVTELVNGVSLNHLNRTSSGIAYSNAVDFIENTVLPELEKLTCTERGLDGFVMPPSWLSPDTQPPWKGKQSWKTLPLKTPEYVFQHGDIAAHNILMDPDSLKVNALIDWEYAGFFPRGMQRWSGSLDCDIYSKRGNDIATLIANYLPHEYLDCYEKWNNKAELDQLVKSGQLPDPQVVKR